MKLSELSTDRALDVLCELTPYASSIMEDGEILSALGGFMNQSADAKEDGTSMSENGIKMFGGLVKNIPLLLRTHRPDVYSILSILNEKTVDEIAAQPVGETIKQIKDVFHDSELLDFFKSSERQEKTASSAPSAGAPASA